MNALSYLEDARSHVAHISLSNADSEGTKSSGKQSDAPEPELAQQEPAHLRSADQLSLVEARALLDKDHYGLDKVLNMHQLIDC